jgi:thioredoxin reductase
MLNRVLIIGGGVAAMRGAVERRRQGLAATSWIAGR